MSQPPTTAVPSMKTFEETYQACFDAGARSVLAITVSSRLSGMFDTATLAGEAFGDRVHVFDSQQISLGLGFQVIEAAIDAQRGNSLPSLLANAERILPRVGVIAMINSLEYLKRSGRVSWLRAGVGDILRIKLLIGLEEGTVVQIGRARTRKNALQQVVDTAASWGPLSRLAVLHSGIPDEATLMADTLKHLASTQPFVVDVTTVIGAHVGPESIGLAVLRE
jgi:DegV family protein with EDD domain